MVLDDVTELLVLFFAGCSIVASNLLSILATIPVLLPNYLKFYSMVTTFAWWVLRSLNDAIKTDKDPSSSQGERDRTQARLDCKDLIR